MAHAPAQMARCSRRVERGLGHARQRSRGPQISQAIAACWELVPRRSGGALGNALACSSGVVEVVTEALSHRMHRLFLFLCLLFACRSSASQQYVAFDSASASSTYSAGNLAGSPAFAAQQALSGGSGYWYAYGNRCPCRGPRLCAAGVRAAAMWRDKA